MAEKKDKTTEFSFVLKPGKYGVGVFAMHWIKAGTYLRLFGNDNLKEGASIVRKKSELPQFFQEYCLDQGKTMHCPKDFGRMELGWYLNHSRKPNVYHKKYHYYALRDIKPGEELTIDYNSLEEPLKEDYYNI